MSIQVVVAEWLRRWTRNPLGLPAQVRILPTTLSLIFDSHETLISLLFLMTFPERCVSYKLLIFIVSVSVTAILFRCYFQQLFQTTLRRNQELNDLFHQPMAKSPVMVSCILKRSCLFPRFTPCMRFKFLSWFSSQKSSYRFNFTSQRKRSSELVSVDTKPSHATLIIGP